MSVSPHRIRLRAPWDSQPSSTATGARYARRFGRPTGIGERDSVWLVIDADWRSNSSLLLNGERLAPSDLTPAATARWDVTARLAARNELVIEWPEATATDDAAGPGELPPAIREVRLEIFAATGDDRTATPGAAP